MKRKWEYMIECQCGHTGSIRSSGDEQPDAKPRESYSLEGLNGCNYHKLGIATLDEAFAHMRPRCPVCDQALTPDHIRFE